jgi:hypothetical protein
LPEEVVESKVVVALVDTAQVLEHQEAGHLLKAN